MEAVARSGRQPARPAAPTGSERVAELREQRRKLLSLHYEGHISSEQFGEEQARLTIEIETLEESTTRAAAAKLQADDVTNRFEQLITVLDRIDVAQLWEAATDEERRTLLDELLDSVTVLDDRLLVGVHGAPPLAVAFSEVGLKAPHSEIGGVEGGT